LEPHIVTMQEDTPKIPPANACTVDGNGMRKRCGSGGSPLLLVWVKIPSGLSCSSYSKQLAALSSDT